MTYGANVDMQFFRGGTQLHHVAACATDVGFSVGWVDFFLHHGLVIDTALDGTNKLDSYAIIVAAVLQ